MLELVSCAIKYSIVLEAEGMHTGTLMQVQVGMHSWRAQDRVQPELRQASPERHACADGTLGCPCLMAYSQDHQHPRCNGSCLRCWRSRHAALRLQGHLSKKILQLLQSRTPMQLSLPQEEHYMHEPRRLEHTHCATSGALP